MICFELSRIKLFLSVNGITDQKATETALAVRSMLITIYARCYAVCHGTACRLAPKLLQHHPDKHVICYKLIYSQEDFKPKIREKLQIFSLTGKTIFQ